MQRAMAVLVTLAVLVAGCTVNTADPDPTPSSSSSSPDTPVATPSTPAPGRVAVVVSPDPAIMAETAEEGVRAVTTGLLDGIELRVAIADDVSFIEDMAAFFVTEGYDLVCAIGPGAEAAVRRVARSSPSTRFCAAPARADGMPDNALPIDVRVEEIGYLAGVALSTEDEPSATSLVVDSTTWAPQRVRVGLAAGLEAGGVRPPRVSVLGPVSEIEDLAAAVTELLGQDTARFLSLAGAANTTVLEVLEQVPVTAPAATTAPGETPSPTPTPTATEERFAELVAGPAVRPTEEDATLSDRVLAVVELHLEEAVAEAVRRHVGEWDTTPASVGLTDGVFRLRPAARGRVATALDEAVAAIRAGDLQVPAE